MTISFDPQENEINTLITIAGDLSGKRVLEVGCGDGRLTFRYASQAAQVVAIDPNPDKVNQAGQNLPEELRNRVSFHALGLEEFAARHPPRANTGLYDLVLLSWSL